LPDFDRPVVGLSQVLGEESDCKALAACVS
jgi:hypothetical protein